MSVTNTGMKATNALLTLHYDNGEKSYEMRQSIQPGDQMWVNVGNLIRNHVPDSKGTVLPAGASSGTYDLRDLSPGLGSLMQGNLALDGTFGFNAEPLYANCCGTANPVWDPSILLFEGIESSFDSEINGTDQCNGDLENISPNFSDWWSDDTSIATVTSKQVTPVAAGTTTGSASGDIFVGAGSYCAFVPAQVNVSITVRPIVTISYNPGYVYIGQDPTVVQANLMGGSGTPSGGTFKWSSTANGVSFDNSAAQLVHITATTWTGGTNDTPITLNYTYNGVAATPATVNITQRIFKYLGGDSVILLSNYNGPTTYGYLYQANYNVYANPGGQQVTNGSGISTYENVTLVTSNVPFSPNYGQGALNASSQVVDSLKLTSSAPLPSNLSIIDSQDLGVGGIYVRTNTLTYTAAGVTVTSNGPYN
jgi:hypothetical protein